MVKVLFKGAVFLILSIFVISLVSASFILGNSSSSVASDYSIGKNVSGWINVSFSKQSANSSLISSLGDSINIIDLIKKSSNSGFLYNCDTKKCLPSYLVTNPETTKTFDLQENESAIFGLEFIGGIMDQNSISKVVFNVSSNNPETSTLPLVLEMNSGNAGSVNWSAYVPSGTFGEEDYGCFVGVGTTPASIAISPQYCEEIFLQKTPAVQIGAWVNRTSVPGSSDINLQMKIQKEGSSSSNTCTARVNANMGESRKISCIPSGFKVNEDGTYYVCIQANSTSDNGKYQIASETVHPCGFTGTDTGTNNYDFEIFAQEENYAPNINFTFSDAELSASGSSAKIIPSINSYLSSKYDYNCTDGCVVPIKITAKVAQKVTVSESTIGYSWTGGTYGEYNDLYDVQQIPASITTTGFQKLNLDEAGLKVPSTYGNYTLALSIDGTSLLSQKIFVQKVPTIVSLNPTSTAVKYPTTFILSTSSENNITKYSWDFGDGTKNTTSTNEATHIYNSMNSYFVNVTITDSKGKTASKTFNVNVDSAASIVPTLLSNMENNLNKIQSQMSSFSQFEQQSINNSLGLSNIQQSLSRMNDSILEANDESSYEAILGNLLKINVPKSISKTVSSSGIIFFPTEDNINLDLLKKIGGGDYSSSNSGLYKNAILAWNNDNTNTEINYGEISAVYSDESEKPIVRTFDVQITKSGNDDAYIVLQNMSNLYFGGDYSQTPVNGAYYIDLTSSQKEISFSTSDNVDFVNLPMFISPSLDKLSVIEATPVEETGNRWATFGIIVGIIIAAAIVIWILLSVWYKRKYETFLFKDRNNLYNLITFIENSEKNGLTQREILEKLKKSGWNSEQINYALKKYFGKNTGLPAIIPMGKIFRGVNKKNFQGGNLPNKT